MGNQIIEAALGLTTPWFIQDIDFDVDEKTFGIQIAFLVSSHFAYPGVEGMHPVHDTQRKRYRHLNFVLHECYLGRSCSPSPVAGRPSRLARA